MRKRAVQRFQSPKHLRNSNGMLTVTSFAYNLNLVVYKNPASVAGGSQMRPLAADDGVTAPGS
jgi:hypothetical protein